MEIKAVLNKPYTEQERMDFIVENNHNKGYEIKEAENCIEAWGQTKEEQQNQEKERVNGLKCTKRNFALILQQIGISYSTLKELISSNEQAQLEWDLCIELERSNPLLDTLAQNINIDSTQLDAIFRFANGEIENIPGVNKND